MSNGRFSNGELPGTRSCSLSVSSLGPLDGKGGNGSRRVRRGIAWLAVLAQRKGVGEKKERENGKEMALKRVDEKHWNCKTPKLPYPQCPGASGVFLAPSGGGKSSTIVSLLLSSAYAKFVEGVHVFSPSCDQGLDSIWDPVREFAKGLKESSFHSEWDEPALIEILSAQREKIKELKNAKSKKPLPQILVIVDDHADNPQVMHSASNILTTLYVRGRHMGTSCWAASQQLTACSRILRVNMRFICCWRLRNKKELLDGLLYELSALYPVPVLHDMYEMATQEDHSFWYINLVAKKKEDMMFIRFEHKMVVDTNDGADPPRLEDGQLDAGGAVADLDET